MSAKSRSRAKLTGGKLHTLTLAKSTGIGATRSSNLGQGKRTIWIGEEKSSSCREGASTFDDDVAATVRTAANESYRAKVIFSIRKRLVRLCGSNTPPPLLAVERWLLNSLEYRRESTHSSKGRVLENDPLFGGLFFKDQDVTKAFVSDLLRASISKKRALEITRRLLEYARDLLLRQKRGEKVRGSVLTIKHRHSLDVRFGTAKNGKRILKLNHEHDSKLRSLWKLAHGKPVDEAQYRIDLYCLLSRYFSIQGHGFQAACPEEVFSALRKRFDVRFECFASPLNTYYGHYCSAFADVDAPFGSSGSFWKWCPPRSGGSFQANPPFVASVMLKMANKILELVAAPTTSPLCFVVVIPGWTDDEAFVKMSRSLNTRAHISIAKDDHGFCDGAQHHRRDRFRTSPYDTSVFVIANDAGARKWPMSDEIAREIRVAFASGIPTKSEQRRRSRDGRGFGDEDGGGGVYKGKKKKQTGIGVETRKRRERKRRRRETKRKDDGA